MAIAGALGAGIGNTLLALTIVLIPPLVRVTESATTQVRSIEFVDAARASGAGNALILRVHVLSNVIGPVLVYATSLLSVSIIMAAGLSFIGLGAKPPTPEWGLMLNTLRNAIYTQPLLAALAGRADLPGVAGLQPAGRRPAQRDGGEMSAAPTETMVDVAGLRKHFRVRAVAAWRAGAGGACGLRHLVPGCVPWPHAGHCGRVGLRQVHRWRGCSWA